METGSKRMDVMETGLRHRLQRAARQIDSQHQQMTRLYGQLERALEDGELERIRDWLRRYREAQEAHFALEDQIVFPALLGYRPAWQARLSQLLVEHERFRAELREIEEQLERGSDDPAPRIAALARALAEHERHEVSLMGSVFELGSTKQAGQS